MAFGFCVYFILGLGERKGLVICKVGEGFRLIS